MRKGAILFLFLVLSLLSSACTQPSRPLPNTPDPTASDLRGTLYAPAGGDVLDTFVVACYVISGVCDETRSQEVQITTSGASASFEFTDLPEQSYTLIAGKDTNGNGLFEDNGDYYGGLGDPVTPPAQGLEIQLEVIGEPANPGPETPEPFSVTGIVLDT